MSRRFFSFATMWHVSNWFATLVFAFGMGVLALTGCSGNSDSDGADGRAVTGVEDSADPPSKAARDDDPSISPSSGGTGSQGNDGTGPLARSDPPGSGRADTPRFPSGSDRPLPHPAGRGEGTGAVDPSLPPLPEGVALRRPSVVLSAGHEALCRVRVGDGLPSFTLPDVAAQDQALPDLLGGKLTVVVFWTLQHPYATEQFERLGAEVVGPYAEFGVNVIAINVGDTTELVRAAGQQVDANFPILLDADGTAFHLVATEKLPRTYLLDPSGRILWFDIEYSESTRRELNNAILWHLVKEPIIATR